MRFFKKHFFLIIFIFSFFVYIAHTAYTKTSIFADARFYYSTTRSLVKDRDIKFANEYSLLGMDKAYTINNYSWNQYPPGTSFFWVPLFSFTEGFTNLISPPLWNRAATTGFELIYQYSAAISSIFLGIFGLYLTYLFLTDYFSKNTSLTTVFILFAATNLLFYIAVEPINSHAVSFFVSSFFVFFFLRCQKDRNYLLILGIIAGIAGLVRTQDLLITTLPLIKIIIDERKQFISLIKKLLILTSGVIIGFLPQIYFWKKIFGTFWYSPYLNYGINIFKPHISFVLFNSQNGLFTITPIIAFSILGLLLFKRKQNLLRNYAIIYFVAQLYLISSWSSYYQGGSFSIRMIITTYPLLSLGIARLIQLASKSIKQNSLFYIGFGFFALNCISIINYLLSF